MDVQEIKQEVQRRYGAFAETGGQREAFCGAPAVAGSAYAVDQGLYSADELALVPPGALDLSRGCGNPTGFADLHSGEAGGPPSPGRRGARGHGPLPGPRVRPPRSPTTTWAPSRARWSA